jgi:signal transduction histidine kinase
MRAARANALLIGVLVLLVAGLAVLATLQYRWIDAVSEAERQRTRASLQLAARQFADELQAEVGQIGGAFGSGGGDVEERLAEWRQHAAHPRLIVSATPAMDLDRPRPFDPRTFELTVRERGGGPPPPDAEGPDPGPDRGRNDIRFETFVVVKLDRRELTTVVLPELAQRHFANGYDVAVVADGQTLFRTDQTWPDGRLAPDVETPLRVLPPPPENGPRHRRDRDHDGDRGPRDGAPRDRDDDSPLRLLVRRHDGGLDAMVAAARRRNLAVSFGVLVILGATFGVLLYLLRRADRLREQQTEFVAAISHELNTPVTALRSAGENLKDGIITDPAKLTRYGETIVKESARLADMIEQVLEFAGMRARRHRASSEPVDVAAVIEEAIAQTRGTSGGEAVQFETHVDEDLPQLVGDPRALTRAIQNLVANAVRHGGRGGWVGVRAARAGASRITITVEDRGPGIDSRDAAHLFEPFYRGRGSSAVRGSGLGLTIVQQIAAAHGGTVDVDRRRRNGAAFTITLPAQERNV